MDQFEIVKKCQKLLDQHINRVEKRRCKYTKYLNDDLVKLETLDIETKKQKVTLDDLSQTKNMILKSIKEQNEIEEEQKIEMVRLKQQMKILSKKFSILSSQDFEINESDRERAFRKRLRLSMIKVSTKVYIDENSPPNVIRGFAGDDVKKMLFPFEFDTKVTCKQDCREQLWELSKKTSRYPSEWENLFAV